MRVLVVGGAGMIGSHVCETLLADDHEVWCLDNLLTGFRASVAALTDRPGFTLVNADVSQALPATLPPVDWILHLASPASPLDFRRLSLEIMAVNARGTEHLLALARQHGSRFLFASTSEVYGDPQEHPQRETYWGHVNPIGLRGCYDESKRYGEALTMAYGRRYDLDVRIVRIFNTYGPRTRHYDGRVVPSFICSALAGEPLIVIGTGEQTRSFCYVTDLAAGILRVIAASESAARGEVFNLGNPDEWTVGKFAALVVEVAGSRSPITRQAVQEADPVYRDDPGRRCPDITKARTVLGWEPTVPLREGLAETIAWYRATRGSEYSRPPDR